MNLGKLKALSIGDLTARLPIIQGGMGVGISLSGLAVAVANEGGIGVIASAGIGMVKYGSSESFFEGNIKALREEIRKARNLTKGILGVNIMVALTNFAETVKASIEEGIDIIFSGAGLPLNLPEFLDGSETTKLVPIVSSARAANLICQKWWTKYKYLPDAVVVEGPMAGGHLGFKEEQIGSAEFSLDNIIVDVISTMERVEDKYGKKIPVVAAGGVYTGEDIYRLIKLGVSGVQMATRFVTTEECDASIEFKNAYLNCEQDDIIVIKSPVGMPGRVIRNSFTDDIENGISRPYKCSYKCIVTCDYKNSPYCIAEVLSNAQKGNMGSGFAFAGQNAYRTKEIVSVKELMATLQREFELASLVDAQNNQ